MGIHSARPLSNDSQDEQVGEVDVGINVLEHLRWLPAFPRLAGLAAFACGLTSCAGVEK